MMRFLVPTAGQNSRPRCAKIAHTAQTCPDLQAERGWRIQGLQKPFPATAFPQVGGEGLRNLTSRCPLGT